MKNSCAFLMLLMAGLVPQLVTAQSSSEEARLSEIARSAAQQFAAARAEIEQTRPTVPITSPGPNVELTLDEATARALERNLDIAVERLNPQLEEFSLARLRGAYRPTATSTMSSTRTSIAWRTTSASLWPAWAKSSHSS